MAPPDLSLYVGRFEAPGRSSPRATRSHSISSDRPSLSGYGGLLSPPVLISPEPAFIAASAASQIVTNDHDSQSDTWFDQHGIEPSGETALVSPPALKLVNRFLDQLLFNFLSISRSTSLASLRPAVGEVLKPKLAKDAINGADQELHEYLGGGDDDELLAFHNGVEPSGDWDLELVWKRTRLRCMVYSSLGDMEEEDEDFYTEQEQLDGPPGSNNRFSNNPGVVSPAVAIFLTSILEFMGEQVLVVAGQASYYRLRAKHEKEERDGSSTTADIADRVVVEESDMERVALDRTMGRLWRGWKKRIRSPTASISMARSFSRESMRSLPQTSRAASIAPGDFNIEGDSAGQSLATVLAEHDHAASIPLPLSADDVREIEIPGLAKQSDDEMDDASEEEDIRPPPRPKSMLIFTTHTSEDLPQPHTPVFAPKSRKRSHSVPSPVPTPYTSSSKCSTPSDEMAGEDQHVTPEMEHVEEGESGEKPAATTEEVSEKGVEGETTKNPDHNKGTLARAIAGATAFGAAAVSGIIAAANGGAPQTELGVKDETDGEEEFTEEPQILTSSRVSIGGRISPDDPKAPSRQSSVRSPSVHSLRLIDVAPQKSPARSRHGSVDAADYISAGGRPVLSRSNSMQSPILLESQNPRVGSPIQRGPNASPLARNGSPLSQRHTTNSAGESISEVEEKEINDSDSAPMTAVPSDLAAAMQGVDVDPSPTSQTPINRDPPSQRSAFVLAAAPSPRNRDNTSVPVNKSHISQLGSNLPVGSKALGVENGIPPLTPLREMMEGAPDASDEASSITPSYDAHSLSEHAIDSHSPSVSASTLAHSQRATEPGKLARPPTANIPRSSPPRSSRDESSRKVAPEPMARAQRPIHTSGSGSSTSTHKLKPVWTSEENGPTAVEDTSQSFEQLMRSDQTIQYTLTPPNMRNIEGPDSPHSPRSPRSLRFPRHAPAMTPNEVQRPQTGRSHSSSVGKTTGLHSNPPEPPKSSKSQKAFKPVPRQASNTGTKLRANAAQPRDARVDRDSIGDLAEFIRSTGPVPENDLPPRSAPNVNGHRGMNGTTRNASGSAPRVGAVTTLPRRAESSAGRSRLQARDAAVPRGDSISDLIDFVRSGPQLEKENHRIPRTVAPFRTTMDSDQMSGAVGGKAIDATLPDPRYSQASASVHSSVTSQSGLLNNSSRNKSLPSQNQNFDEEDMMPKRKTRRVRDPYAIDFSDEEDEYEAVSRPKPIQEESLADFLRNVPPPPDAVATSVFETVPKPSGKNIKKKSSTPSLMSRFGRNSSGPQLPPKPKSNGNDSRIPVSRSGAPQLPVYTPIAAKFSSTPATYEPNRGSNYVSQLDSARNKVAQKNYQPREAVYASSRTNDLAEFLTRSEPPSSMQTQPRTFTPPLQKEEASAFQRMFGRKKVH